MGYFYDWSNVTQQQVGPKELTQSIRESFYISSKTHNNLNVLCKGFCEYSRSLLRKTPDAEFVPALHSNQSSIENHFSCIRQNNKDRTDVYGTGVMHQNIKTSIMGTQIENYNTSYPLSMINSEEKASKFAELNMVQIKNKVLSRREYVTSFFTRCDSKEIHDNLFITRT